MILYRNSYREDEKLFSTGDSELDNLLTEVYYSGLEDGYDYAQKEFATHVNLKPYVSGQRWTNFRGKLPNKVNSSNYLTRAARIDAIKNNPVLSESEKKKLIKEIYGFDPRESIALQRARSKSRNPNS